MRFRDALRALPRAGPFLWSHHPRCTFFRADVVRVAGTDVCVACFWGLPLIAVGAFTARALAPQVGTTWWVWALVGLVLAAPQGLSFAGRIPGPRSQVAVKSGLGLGLGLFLFGLSRVPGPLAVRLLSIAAGLLVVQSFWVLRLHRLDRTCRRCPELPMRPRCTGLGELEFRVGKVLRGQDRAMNS